MAIQQAPPQPPSTGAKKAGLGCLGCGCLIVLVFFLLLAGLAGGVVYTGYHELYLVSSGQPMTIKPFTGGDDIFDGAQKKLAAFNQDVSAGKASTLTLSADEINSIIAHNVTDNPDLKKFQIQALVSMQGDQVRLQGEAPSNTLPVVSWGIKDRYFNLDATTGVRFNTETKEVEFDFRKVQIGDYPVPQDSLPSMEVQFEQSFNRKLRENTAVWNVLQVAKTVTIRDGQFVIETK
jgi:hypothetical protein